MSRYIDDDEAKKSICALDCENEESYICRWRNTCHAMKAIDKTPTADVVPVVRCKDCKHCDITEVFDAKTAKSRQELFCMRYGMDIPGDWFCADGEKVSV